MLGLPGAVGDIGPKGKIGELGDQGIQGSLGEKGFRVSIFAGKIVGRQFIITTFCLRWNVGTGRCSR